MIMNSFTSYSSVNKILNILLKNISDILKEQFVGIYIHGSLALHDFVPERSDIDLVVLTKEVLLEETLKKLKVIHDKISSSKLLYAQRIECIYIPIDSLRNYSQEKAYFPCLHVGGEFYTDGFGIIEKHVLREKEIIIKGPDTKSFMKPVTAAELKKAALDSLREWWLPKLKDHSKLLKDDYQVYAVLTMCRALYTIQFGDIASKSTAAQYAVKTLDAKWAKLIRETLSWKNREKFNKLDETLNFIKYTIKKLNV